IFIDGSFKRFRRAINPFTDSIGKRNTGGAVDRDLPKRYFDALAGQSQRKRSNTRKSFNDVQVVRGGKQLLTEKMITTIPLA
uniref:Uncharacterized protein n=1 Tax=Parascaris equorum TaxID=6256 RepID=A0A914RRL4_PAREQ